MLTQVSGALTDCCALSTARCNVLTETVVSVRRAVPDNEKFTMINSTPTRAYFVLAETPTSGGKCMKVWTDPGHRSALRVGRRFMYVSCFTYGPHGPSKPMRQHIFDQVSVGQNICRS